MCSQVNVRIRVNESVEVDTYTFSPKEPQIDVVCVMLHPWSVLGGSQGNMVPFAKTLAAKHGIYTVTFDTRGTGDSTGSKSMTGKKEVEDVIAVCEWITKNLGKPIVLMGYSAGAAIAGSALDRIAEVKAYVGLAYTFGWWTSWMFGSHYSAVSSSAKPKLFIMGSRDELTSPSQLLAKTSSMSKVETLILDGAGHFGLEGGQYVSRIVAAIATFVEKEISQMQNGKIM